MTKAISFRWKPEVIDKLNEGAEKQKMSKTMFVAEAVNLLSSITKMSEFKGEPIEEVKAQVLSLLKQEALEERVARHAKGCPVITYLELSGLNILSNPDFEDHNKKTQIPKKRAPGYIFDLMYEFIKSKNGRVLTTSEISEELGISKSTARAYVNRIHKKYNGEFTVYNGKPKQIKYNK